MSLRPSGIQQPALTEERSLLSAECTNRVHADAAASGDASSVYGEASRSGQSVRSLSIRTVQAE